MAAILLVEDDPIITRMIALRLSIAGHTIDQAVNGLEGYQAALANPYDLILMDMHMPVMDGREAVRRLRSEDYRGLIIAVTASAMNEDTEAAFGAGCDYFISKPIGDDFEQRLEKILVEPRE